MNRPALGNEVNGQRRGHHVEREVSQVQVLGHPDGDRAAARSTSMPVRRDGGGQQAG